MSRYVIFYLGTNNKNNSDWFMNLGFALIGYWFIQPKPERKKVDEVISDSPSTKTQTRRVPWSTAPNPPRRTIPVYVPQTPLINMSRPLTGSFGESIIIVGGAMYIAALIGAATGGGILISM